MKRAVLAYSGGLDTSVAIPWLSEQGWEVIAVAVDVGQPEDLGSTITRAETLGAVEARLENAIDSFATEYVAPALHMNAAYQGQYPLVSALSRPLISKVLVDVARQTGAEAVAHGCTGKGNDQVRFETSLSALAPDLEVLAPVRDWGMSRTETIAYAEERELPITTTKTSPYSIDENLWGRSVECGVLEDPWATPPEDVFTMTASPWDAGPPPDEMTIEFRDGIPAAVDGDSLSLASVVERVGRAAGASGFGRIDIVEDRLVGIKSREIYEAPGAMALISAHRDLEGLTLERGLAAEKRRLEITWAELVYRGLWFSPLREALDAFARSSQERVTGEVRLRFASGSCTPVGRRSPVSLYDESLATYESGDAFGHEDAAGFVRLWSLPTTQWARASDRRD
ncbi:MAG: argininosuccinate synthase [Actinobacteria bacterium]|nr:argininosuccinate synthase [Actinomycetota bacterium]